MNTFQMILIHYVVISPTPKHKYCHVFVSIDFENVNTTFETVNSINRIMIAKKTSSCSL